ncbi:MAG TPA: ATP-binding protein, partial [Thermoanaerobaculia bacterium]|nr:ATP-binding protein [Thermoanaerobaculia bacterium]
VRPVRPVRPYLPYTCGMGSGSAPVLTKVGFRRDVKWFLGLLVGFLIVLILTLVLILADAVSEREQAVEEQWQIRAAAAADMLNQLDGSHPSTIEAALLTIRTRLGVPAVSITLREGSTLRSGELMGESVRTLEKNLRWGAASFYFDRTSLDEARRTFLLTAGIAVGSTALALLLLLLYLPRIVRPIEQMLDHAQLLEERDESIAEDRYLIETFRRSIERLKAQEEELKQLHEVEKSRADELEMVTATLTRSLISGFIALDAEGRLIDLNRSAREILRLDLAEQNAGRPSTVAIENAGLPPRFTEILRDGFSKKLSLSRREIQESDGMLIGLTTVPLLNEQDRFLGMLALFTDLTPVRDLESRMREMQALADLGEISAGIAHEFRNSLSTILGYLKLAQRQESAAAMIERIRKAEEEATLLAASIEGLLSFAKPVELDREEIDLHQLASGLVEQLRLDAPEIDFSIQGPPAIIRGDRILLRRSVENILRNAVDSVRQRQPEEGQAIAVEIDAEPVPTMRVVDNGVGIDPDQAARLFLPFHSGKASGTGLGLAIARKVALLHGGSIAITGAPGKGATVTMTLRQSLEEPPSETRPRASS